jgi:isochorismate synthase/2-succinyl-5-enolpyruvyl-6-hydroxy-3-cyclohexene-1-carboxylate synthase/2-succinyl-6-hydroxy-2,4-cyclohexadiene-1-carboxylate synthase/O-succinylbenzoate synthase
MCRAQGIPHAKVSSLSDLHAALQCNWGFNRHSVIEVATNRLTNVDHHRRVQRAAQRALQRTLRALQPLVPSVELAAPASGQMGGSPSGADIVSASYELFSLALAAPLTTGAQEQALRHGALILLEISVPASIDGQQQQQQQHTRTFVGVGEVCPLPGLHRESMREAEQQLHLLCTLLRGVVLPPMAAMLGGRLGAWLEASVGLGPSSLLPSVRAGLEQAVLSALAAAAHRPIAAILAASTGLSHSSREAAELETGGGAVALNALLDCQGSSPEEAAGEAAKLVEQGFQAIKIKVCFVCVCVSEWGVWGELVSTA